MADYEDYREFGEQTAPTIFRGENGERLLGLMTLLIDALADGTTLALKAPWLQLETFPPDGAAPLGRESNLEAYPEESRAEFLARLRRRWTDWQFAGHESSIINQLAAAGYPGAEILFFPAAPGPHGESNYWSQFWVFFPFGTHPVTGPATPWGDFDWGDGTLYGPQGATLSFVQTVKGIIRKWKPGHWICRAVIFQIAGGEQWGGFNWGDGTTYGGTAELEF